jgi:predicted PurR-regulated permease PerM
LPVETLQHPLKRENSLRVANAPFYLKASIFLIGLCAFVAVLYFAQEIILPLIFAAIAAVLLNPIALILERCHIPRILSIFITVLLALFAALTLMYFISLQLSSLIEASAGYKEKIDAMQKQTIGWVSAQVNIAPEKLTAWVSSAERAGTKNSGALLEESFSFLTGAILLPVYVIMILWYKPLLMEFLRRVFVKKDPGTANKVIAETETIFQSYFIGLFYEFIIVAALNSAGLLALGIDYAILLGIIGAILNVIPLIGGISAVVLPMLMALVTKDSPLYALLVLVTYVVIQFFDDHFLVPRVVASKVKLNALISIIVVIAGGVLWGIPGMFLSIPLTAIAKVICDRIENLKPWGLLLGNSTPSRRADKAAKDRPSHGVLIHRR